VVGGHLNHWSNAVSIEIVGDSREAVALHLFDRLAKQYFEQNRKYPDKDWLLETYSECFQAVLAGNLLHD
jgi:hypothetical protein